MMIRIFNIASVFFLGRYGLARVERAEMGTLLPPGGDMLEDLMSRACFASRSNGRWPSDMRISCLRMQMTKCARSATHK